MAVRRELLGGRAGQTPATQSVEQLLLIAKAVRPDSKPHITLPLRLAYLPAELRAQQVSYDAQESYGTGVDLTDGPYSNPTVTALNIKIWPDVGPHETMTGATAVLVGGRPGKTTRDGTVSVVIGQREFVISFTGPRFAR